MKAILFDLDGTLVNSIPLILASYHHTLRTHLGYTMSDEEILTTIGRPLMQIFEELYPERAEAMIDTYRKYNFENHDRLVESIGGAEETLEELRKRGYRLGVVTSKSRKGAMKSINLFGLEKYMDTIVALEDTVNHKPEPEPLLAAANNLNLPPSDILYVGDSSFDIMAGKLAKMRTAAVLWGAALKEELLRLSPDIVLYSFPELLFYCPALR